MTVPEFGNDYNVHVTLTPVKPRPGLKPKAITVYNRFGRSRERMVHEICSAIGGHCVYLRAGEGRSVLPIASWGQPSDLGYACGSDGDLAAVANAIRRLAADGVAVRAFGADRVEWELSFRNTRTTAKQSALDSEPDSDASAGALPGGRMTMKRRF